MDENSNEQDISKQNGGVRSMMQYCSRSWESREDGDYECQCDPAIFTEWTPNAGAIIPYSNSTRSLEYGWRNNTLGIFFNTSRECWEVEPDMCRVSNEAPYRADRFGCLGNAIVIHCTQYIGKSITEYEQQYGVFKA